MDADGWEKIDMHKNFIKDQYFVLEDNKYILIKKLISCHVFIIIDTCRKGVFCMSIYYICNFLIYLIIQEKHNSNLN